MPGQPVRHRVAGDAATWRERIRRASMVAFAVLMLMGLYSVVDESARNAADLAAARQQLAQADARQQALQRTILQQQKQLTALQQQQARQQAQTAPAPSPNRPPADAAARPGVRTGSSNPRRGTGGIGGQGSGSGGGGGTPRPGPSPTPARPPTPPPPPPEVCILPNPLADGCIIGVGNGIRLLSSARR